MVDSRSGKKITSFTDLVAWQVSHKLVIRVYEVSKTFPNEEKFGLTSQISRAVVSVTSNIAEGFGRNGSKEKDNFYALAYGSLLEVQNQLLVARDIGYISNETFKELADMSVESAKLLSGLRKANKERNR